MSPEQVAFYDFERALLFFYFSLQFQFDANDGDTFNSRATGGWKYRVSLFVNNSVLTGAIQGHTEQGTRFARLGSSSSADAGMPATGRRCQSCDQPSAALQRVGIAWRARIHGGQILL